MRVLLDTLNLTLLYSSSAAEFCLVDETSLWLLPLPHQAALRRWSPTPPTSTFCHRLWASPGSFLPSLFPPPVPQEAASSLVRAVKWKWKSLSHVWLFAIPLTSLPGSSVYGILQAILLELVAVPFSRGSSQPRDWTQVSRIVGGFLTIWATRVETRRAEVPHLLVFWVGISW